MLVAYHFYKWYDYRAVFEEINVANIIETIFRLEKRELNRYAKEADRVIALEDTMRAMTDDELRAKTAEFKEALKNGKKLDDIKIEAFAVAREGAYRAIKQFPFKVQMMATSPR